MTQGSGPALPSYLHGLHDTGLQTTHVTVNLRPVDGMPVLPVAQARASSSSYSFVQRTPVSALSGELSRDERPGGSLPACAGSDVAHNRSSTPIHLITRWPSLSPP